MGRKTKRRKWRRSGDWKPYSMVSFSFPCLQLPEHLEPALLCVWLSNCEVCALEARGPSVTLSDFPGCGSFGFSSHGLSLPGLRLPEGNSVSGLFCTPCVRCRQADHPRISQGQTDGTSAERSEKGLHFLSTFVSRGNLNLDLTRASSVDPCYPMVRAKSCPSE